MLDDLQPTDRLMVELTVFEWQARLGMVRWDLFAAGRGGATRQTGRSTRDALRALAVARLLGCHALEVAGTPRDVLQVTNLALALGLRMQVRHGSCSRRWSSVLCYQDHRFTD